MNQPEPVADVIPLIQPVPELQSDISWLVEMHHPILKGQR